MAVSNIGNPGDFTPVYNPVVFYFDSTNKNQLGFRYVVDVYYAGTATKIAEFRVAPRPTDGYGYIDLSRILQNLISYNFNGTNTSVLAQPNAQLRYDVKIGEEYVVNYALSAFANNAGNLQITTSTVNTFVLGDQVVINETTLPLATLNTVTNDVSTTVKVIDLPYISAYAITPTGTISYADNRKTITRDLLTYSNYTAYNAAFSFIDFRTYDPTLYKLINTSFPLERALTDMPFNFYAYASQDIWINYAPFFSNNCNYIYFTNSNGDVFRRNVQDNSIAIKQTAVGPNNAGSLTVLAGTAGLVKSDTTYYTFYFANSVGLQISQQYTINIKTDCKIEDYEIVFLDRKGSFGSFAFPLRSKINTKIDREEFNNQIGNVSGGKFTYNTYDTWSTTTNVQVESVYELNSDFFTDDLELKYFEQLMTSPITYIKIQGSYYQCIVQESQNDYNPLYNKKIQRKTINVKVINDIINI